MPNDKTNDIHIQSDHLQSITKQLPRSIEKRLSQLSSSKDIFYKTAPYYEQRLASCGYNEKLSYQQQREKTENIKNIRKNRKHIWFNPLFSKLLKTNIGKYFSRLLNKNFPPGCKPYKIFNKNTLKLSYSCISNLKAKIDGHNKKIDETTQPPKNKIMQLLQKRKLLNERSLPHLKYLHYPRISRDDETYKPKLYKGICKTSFKKRYANHKKSFNVEKNKSDTKLSSE